MNKIVHIYTDVDDYIAQAPSDLQERLHAIRKTIREAVPEAEESIRNNVPSYLLYGRVHSTIPSTLCHFALHKEHIALYLGADTVTVFAKRLTGYNYTKAGILFPHSSLIPYDIISEVISYKAYNQ